MDKDDNVINDIAYRYADDIDERNVNDTDEPNINDIDERTVNDIDDPNLHSLKMKGIVLILLTILVALYMINECEGRRRRWRRVIRRIRIPRYPTLNTQHKREVLTDDIQDEDIESVDSEDGHLDERYVDMDDEDVMDDIDERYVNDPEEED
ncbi:unnamed protein product [Mytilus coruscus]|uniref:Uncharacterized protein n=1 Tax=Mytilus coruscus TaxID=42192 RepID=A0A6J8CTY5_MYTCO|nr:unnamed protein product [Mytilus coruscus]